MKKTMKKLLAFTLAAAMVFSFAACGSNNTAADPTAAPTEAAVATATSAPEATATTAPEATAEPAAELTLPTFDQLELGVDYTDITAEIKVLSHRTDLADTVFPEYIAAFKEMYPNITITYSTETDYAENSLIYLTQEGWGDIMMIPAVDKADLSSYYVSFGDYTTLDATYNFVNAWEYEGQVYGIPSTGNVQGILYNKAVFAAAGITTMPKTPDEFIADLQLISDNTDAIPLYTNYFAGWTMGAWDAYLGGSATGSSTFMNQELVHTAQPFADNGKGYGAYNVYKILYDACANKLIEDDYSTTDWEGCKGMMNRGEIATMVLGSWAVTQMQDAGDKPEDIGYMPFPITVEGTQYATAAADYSYAINVKSTIENQIASMCYIKWLTHESNFAYDQGGVPIVKGEENPPSLADFNGIQFVSDASALAGETSFLNDINAESELAINNGGNAKVQAIVENGFNGTKTFDDIMAEWNQAWSDALTTLGIEAKY